MKKDVIKMNQYRSKYNFGPEVPFWKVWNKMSIQERDLDLDERTNQREIKRRNMPEWINMQLTVQNLVPSSEITKLPNTQCVRIYCSRRSYDITAMYHFGMRLDVCYFDTNDRIEDVVWSYQNSPESSRQYIDFYYHTEINDVSLRYSGSLLGYRKEYVRKDGLKEVPDKSLVKNGEVFYVEKFLDKEEADELFDTLYDLEKFKLYKLYNYNHETKQIDIRSNHRKSYWLGDHAQAVGDTNKGGGGDNPDGTGDNPDDNGNIAQTILVPTDYVIPYEFPMIVWELKEKIEKAYGVEFNSCLVGLYDGPKQKIGYHSDSSDSMGTDPYIGSISLGLSRKFRLKPNKNTYKTTMEEPVEIVLKHGDLVVMRKNANKNYLHSVIKDSKCNENNVGIYLTFRQYDYHPDEMKLKANPF